MPENFRKNNETPPIFDEWIIYFERHKTHMVSTSKMPEGAEILVHTFMHHRRLKGEKDAQATKQASEDFEKLTGHSLYDLFDYKYQKNSI